MGRDSLASDVPLAKDRRPPSLSFLGLGLLGGCLELISRQAAIDAGLKTYFTGKPCPHGHVAPRFVSSYGCTVCAKALTAEWRKLPDSRAKEKKKRAEWLEANKDRVRQSVAEYQARNKEKIRAQSQIWVRSNKDRLNAKRAEKRREWRESNPAQVRARKFATDAEYCRDWYARNAEVVRERRSAPDGKAKRCAYQQKRRARQLQAVPPWFGELDDLVMVESAHLCALRHAYTGVTWEVDHALPLQGRLVSGLHCAANIQVIPGTMNSSKHNRLVLTEPGEWIAKL